MKELTRRAAQLEEEVAAAESRYASLTASLKAASVEADAARDPRQFSRDSFASWFVRRAGPGDSAAVMGLAVGVASGVSLSFVISIIVAIVAE